MAEATPFRLVSAVQTRLALVGLVGLALALAGCGRKGPPELAPGTRADPVTRVIAPEVAPAAPAPAAPPLRTASPAQTQVGPVVNDPGLIQPPDKTYQVPANVQMNQATSAAAPPPINRPPGPKTGKPFILDPLL